MHRLRRALIVLPVLLVSGCGLGDVMALTCDFMDDSDHCYQAAAIQSGNLDYCDKIEGKGFTGSNPPRDKCYMKIAENTGDSDVCDEIKGGFLSYTEAECVTKVAIKRGDFDECYHLWNEERVSCQLAVGSAITAEQIKGAHGRAEEYREQVAKNPNYDKKDPNSPHQFYLVYCGQLSDYCKYASTQVREQAESLCYGSDVCP